MIARSRSLVWLLACVGSLFLLASLPPFAVGQSQFFPLNHPPDMLLDPTGVQLDGETITAWNDMHIDDFPTVGVQVKTLYNGVPVIAPTEHFKPPRYDASAQCTVFEAGALKSVYTVVPTKKDAADELVPLDFHSFTMFLVVRVPSTSLCITTPSLGRQWTGCMLAGTGSGSGHGDWRLFIDDQFTQFELYRDTDTEPALAQVYLGPLQPDALSVIEIRATSVDHTLTIKLRSSDDATAETISATIGFDWIPSSSAETMFLGGPNPIPLDVSADPTLQDMRYFEGDLFEAQLYMENGAAEASSGANVPQTKLSDAERLAIFDHLVNKWKQILDPTSSVSSSSSTGAQDSSSTGESSSSGSQESSSSSSGTEESSSSSTAESSSNSSSSSGSGSSGSVSSSSSSSSAGDSSAGVSSSSSTGVSSTDDLISSSSSSSSSSTGSGLPSNSSRYDPVRVELAFRSSIDALVDEANLASDLAKLFDVPIEYLPVFEAYGRPTNRLIVDIYSTARTAPPPSSPNGEKMARRQESTTTTTPTPATIVLRTLSAAPSSPMDQALALQAMQQNTSSSLYDRTVYRYLYALDPSLAIKITEVTPRASLDSDDSGDHRKEILGGVIGAFCALVLLSVCVVYCIHRRTRQLDADMASDELMAIDPDATGDARSAQQQQRQQPDGRRAAGRQFISPLESPDLLDEPSGHRLGSLDADTLSDEREFEIRQQHRRDSTERHVEMTRVTPIERLVSPSQSGQTQTHQQHVIAPAHTMVSMPSDDDEDEDEPSLSHLRFADVQSASREDRPFPVSLHDTE